VVNPVQDGGLPMPHKGRVVAGPHERYGDPAEEDNWRGRWQ
jgi:hypothetical protein